MERKCKKLIKTIKDSLKLDGGSAAPQQEQPVRAAAISEEVGLLVSHSSVAGSVLAQEEEEDNDDDDDFGYDPERYVPYDEKSELSESIKKVTKEGLT